MRFGQPQASIKTSRHSGTDYVDRRIPRPGLPGPPGADIAANASTSHAELPCVPVV